MSSEEEKKSHICQKKKENQPKTKPPTLKAFKWLGFASTS